jgi:hypothetical protein
LDVPARDLWERGYAAEAARSLLPIARTLDEALAVVRPFLDPLLQDSAAGWWDPTMGAGCRDPSRETGGAPSLLGRGAAAATADGSVCLHEVASPRRRGWLPREIASGCGARTIIFFICEAWVPATASTDQASVGADAGPALRHERTRQCTLAWAIGFAAEGSSGSKPTDHLPLANPIVRSRAVLMLKGIVG